MEGNGTALICSQKYRHWEDVATEGQVAAVEGGCQTARRSAEELLEKKAYV